MAPSSSTTPSSNNLLRTDPNPKSMTKPDPPAAPPNSASSSSTTSAPPPEKRTRDQPNLSDCHCCGRRINSTNPKDRLQPLDSVWRIVLLCRKCRRNVHSGQTCPYCFRGTGNSGDSLTCGVCHRKIHKDCVKDYGNCTPWCYLGAGSEGFRVCVDCWVPELLKNSIRVCGRSENKSGSGEGKDLLGHVSKSAKCEVGKKVKSRGKVGKNDAFELVNDALIMLGGKDKDSSKAENANCSDTIEVVDDAEMAIKLHRAINSSPRILKSKWLVNSNESDVSNIRKWTGLSYKRSRLGKNRGEGQNLGTCTNDSCADSAGLNLGLKCYKRDKTRKIWQLLEDNPMVSESTSSQPVELKCNLPSGDAKTRCSNSNDAGISEAPFLVNADRNNIDRFQQELVSYRRSRFKRKLFPGESSSLDNHGAAFKSEFCQIDDREISMGCQVKSDSKAILPSGSCDAYRDRYHLKYGKRAKGTNLDSSFVRLSTLRSQHKASQLALNNSEPGCDKEWDRYHLKYGKRAKGTKTGSHLLHYSSFLSDNQASAPDLNNCAAGYTVKSDGKLVLQIGTINQGPDRYCLKYTKRIKSSKSGSNSETKMHSGVFLKEIEAFAAGVTTNCSAESRTPSDVTFDSLTVAPHR